MDENQLAQLYQQYLGRAPDPSGIATWSGQDPSAVIAGIMGSPEYQSRGGGGGGGEATPMPSPGPGGLEAVPVSGDNYEQQLNQIYQNVLGRSASGDPGAQGWIDALRQGFNPQDIVAQIASSQEARNRAFQGLPSSVAQNDPNNFASNIIQTYATALGRAPTPEELKPNIDRLNRNPDEYAYFVKNVTESPEAKAYAQRTGVDLERTAEIALQGYGKWTPAASSPEPGGLGGLFMKYGPYLPFIAAAAASAPALLAAEGAAAAPGFVGLDAATATQLGLSGGSALGTAGAAGDVLAGIYGAGAAAPGFVGLTPEFATELGLSGGSGLGIEGAAGDVLAGIYGAGATIPAWLAGPLSAIGSGALSGAGRTLASNLLGGAGTGGTRAPMGGYLPGGGTNINIQQPQTIPNLQAGIVRGQPIDLDMPEFNQQLTPIEAAAGGSIDSDYEDSNYGDTVSNLAKLKPNLMKGKSDFNLQKYWDSKYAEGGEVEHNPEFFSEGGLQNRYVKGAGDGTSDDVPAMLANGEFVIPADVVSDLGNGSNDSGAELLDEFLQVIREHKRKADAKHLPPDSKGPLGYLLEAKHKVR